MFKYHFNPLYSIKRGMSTRRESLGITSNVLEGEDTIRRLLDRRMGEVVSDYEMGSPLDSRNTGRLYSAIEFAASRDICMNRVARYNNYIDKIVRAYRASSRITLRVFGFERNLRQGYFMIPALS